MEERFGRDFGHVRVHTDQAAAQSAVDVGAKAYTVGNHIAFKAGEYAPDTTSGRRSIAHELSHVVQQNRGGNSYEPRQEDSRLEHAADRAAATVTTEISGAVHVIGASAPSLARQEDEGKKKELELTKVAKGFLGEYLSEAVRSAPGVSEVLNVKRAIEQAPETYKRFGGGVKGATAAVLGASPLAPTAEEMVKAYKQYGGGVGGFLMAANQLNPAFHAAVGFYEANEARKRGDSERLGAESFKAVKGSVDTVLLATGAAKAAASKLGGAGKPAAATAQRGKPLTPALKPEPTPPGPKTKPAVKAPAPAKPAAADAPAKSPAAEAAPKSVKKPAPARAPAAEAAPKSVTKPAPARAPAAEAAPKSVTKPAPATAVPKVKSPRRRKGIVKTAGAKERAPGDKTISTTEKEVGPGVTRYRHKVSGQKHVGRERLDDVHAYSKKIGHTLRPHGLKDNTKLGGKAGDYNAGHAEKLHEPNSPQTVDKPMCSDCRDFKQKSAKHEKRTQVVNDPDMTREFHPDGSVTYRPRSGGAYTLPPGHKKH
jgi:hypothetical protein